jgi:hypothetical protein
LQRKITGQKVGASRTTIPLHFPPCLFGSGVGFICSGKINR